MPEIKHQKPHSAHLAYDQDVRQENFQLSPWRRYILVDNLVPLSTSILDPSRFSHLIMMQKLYTRKALIPLIHLLPIPTRNPKRHPRTWERILQVQKQSITRNPELWRLASGFRTCHLKASIPGVQLMQQIVNSLPRWSDILGSSSLVTWCHPSVLTVVFKSYLLLPCHR